MKYVTAIKDYNHRQTGEKVITEGMAYSVFKEKQHHYWISNDNDKYMWVNKNIFRNGIWRDLYERAIRRIFH